MKRKKRDATPEDLLAREKSVPTKCRLCNDVELSPGNIKSRVCSMCIDTKLGGLTAENFPKSKSTTSTEVVKKERKKRTSKADKINAEIEKHMHGKQKENQGTPKERKNKDKKKEVNK